MKHPLLPLVLLALAAILTAPPILAQADPPQVTSLFDHDRSDREDVIYFRNQDVLRGEVLNDTIGLTTQYGVLAVPLDRCAGLSFEGARTNTEALVTTNFNRLTGIITDRVIRFRIGSSGTEIPIRKEKIRFILMKRTAKEAEFTKKSPKADLFLMANGDLLSGEAREREIRTDYGIVPVGFAEMADVQMQGGDNVTAVIKKTNGDTMRGTLETEELSLDLEIGVRVDAVYKDKFARVFVDLARRQAPAQLGVQQPLLGESDGVGLSIAGGEVITNSLGMKMRRIPAGSFMMGSENGDSDEKPVHEVKITKAFYLGVTEVTQTQWKKVMGSNPAGNKGDDLPVESVSWEECMGFCSKLTEIERASGKLPATWKYTLPTEAQWEYACRAKSTTPYSFAGFNTDLPEYAWCKLNSGGKTHPVGKKKPNAWGLQDTHGNVWEWCLDAFDSNFYERSPEEDPFCNSGSNRVLRGGSYSNDAGYLRSANRSNNSPGYRTDTIGFRLAKVALRLHAIVTPCGDERTEHVIPRPISRAGHRPAESTRSAGSGRCGFT